MQMRTLFAIHQVRAKDNRPDKHKQNRGNGCNHRERANHAGIHIQHHHAAEQTDTREGQPFRGYCALREFSERFRCHTFLGQTKQHTAGREDTAVSGRRRRGQHHKVDRSLHLPGKERLTHQHTRSAGQISGQCRWLLQRPADNKKRHIQR